MKYIWSIPEPVVIAEAHVDANPALSRPAVSWTLRQAVQWVVDNAEHFQRPASRIRAAARIFDAFEAPGVVELKDEDWEALNAEFEAATSFGQWSRKAADGSALPWHVPPRRFLGFVDAINEAKNSPPPKPVEASQAVGAAS